MSVLYPDESPSLVPDDPKKDVAPAPPLLR
jgi:hypothetical protein